MRVKVINHSPTAGLLLVDHGNEDWPDNPPRQKMIAGGETIELAIGQRGRLLACGFEKLEIVPVAKHEPKKPSKTKAANAGASA